MRSKGRRLFAFGDGNDATPVSSMRTFWGLMRAYWFSDRWREAWTLTLLIAVLTALVSKASVWIAESSGELVNAIAFFHDKDTHSPLAAVLSSAGMLLFLVVIKDAAFNGVRGYISATLHRRWRGWLNSRFNEALLSDSHTHFHVQHGTGGDNVAPDNIDQRVQESVKGMTGGAIGLAMGILSVLTSLFFVGQRLLETSAPVHGLEFLGMYGSAVLAFGAVAVYVPLNTYVAVRLGRILEFINIAMQQAEGSYRGELTTLFRRSFQVAAACGEKVQKTMHDRLYVDIDQNWAKLNKVSAVYTSFQHVYDFFAARMVAYAPGLIPYVNEKISLRSYITGAELVNSLIVQCSWFIHVMPAIATLRANSKRVTDLAKAIEEVSDPAEFYRSTGLSDFRYGRQNARFGLTVRKLELMHRGDEAAPFLTATGLRFRPGEWTFIKGDSGCGKTSLLKALNGLWAYGRGDIVFPQGVGAFYASQDIKLQALSLKQLVCLPDDDELFSDARVAAALHKAGIGDFIEFLSDETCAGKPWDQVLSGGQKQKLMLARILLHKPGLLFLDEATGALDPDARIAFHQAIKDNCAEATVISVMHESEPPRSHAGVEFYDSILHIQDGTAVKAGWEVFWPQQQNPNRAAAPVH
jgi:ABC-type uncharacterized transport system fused permease/ATPase subunit